jgi:hypothetical protein
VDATRIALAPSTAHLERWSVADHVHVESTEIRLPACAAQSLSPDARIVGCVDFGGTLRLVVVASGEIIFEKTNSLHSPDSRFVVPSLDFSDAPAVAWDLVEKKALKLAGGLHQRSPQATSSSSLRTGW